MVDSGLLGLPLLAWKLYEQVRERVVRVPVFLACVPEVSFHPEWKWWRKGILTSWLPLFRV